MRPSSSKAIFASVFRCRCSASVFLDGIQDREILGRHQATAAIRAQLGIAGIPNRSANDGTITRFGWKAQNKSIAIFAGEAYNVEMGVTNDLFTQQVDESPGCNADKAEPNDIFRSDPTDVRNQAFNNPLHEIPDWLMFAIFMRFLDAPQPVAFSASAQRGQQLFGTDPGNPGIGCFACHSPTMVTPPKSETTALQSVTRIPTRIYSSITWAADWLTILHRVLRQAICSAQLRSGESVSAGSSSMTVALAISWLPFSHISRRRASAGHCRFFRFCSGLLWTLGSEYCDHRFNTLSVSDQQAILDFLRSL